MIREHLRLQSAKLCDRDCCRISTWDCVRTRKKLPTFWTAWRDKKWRCHAWIHQRKTVSVTSTMLECRPNRHENCMLSHMQSTVNETHVLHGRSLCITTVRRHQCWIHTGVCLVSCGQTRTATTNNLLLRRMDATSKGFKARAQPSGHLSVAEASL